MDARWLPPPGLRPPIRPRCCRSRPHKGGLVSWPERVGADTYDPAGAIEADLAIFEEEVVDTVPGPPIAAGAARQPTRAVLEADEQPVELIQVRLPRGGHDSCSTTVPGG
jgi:hypothetical protein